MNSRRRGNSTVRRLIDKRLLNDLLSFKSTVASPEENSCALQTFVVWFSSHTAGACLDGAIAPRFFESGLTWLRHGRLPTKLEWLRGLNALRVLAQVSAAEQIVGRERRERVSHHNWSGDA